MKNKTHIKLSLVVYNLICNIPVCFFLCLTSAIISASDFDNWVLTINFNNINWFMMLMNFLIAFALAMCIGLFVPLTRIGRWFAGLFHVKNETYTGNMKYRLLATLSSSLIFYIIITPTLTMLNCFVFTKQGWNAALFSLIINAPLMILVGFVSSLLSDLGAYKVAHHIDHTF